MGRSVRSTRSSDSTRNTAVSIFTGSSSRLGVPPRCGGGQGWFQRSILCPAPIRGRPLVVRPPRPRPGARSDVCLVKRVDPFDIDQPDPSSKHPSASFCSHNAPLWVITQERRRKWPRRSELVPGVTRRGSSWPHSECRQGSAGSGRRGAGSFSALIDIVTGAVRAIADTWGDRPRGSRSICCQNPRRRQSTWRDGRGHSSAPAWGFRCRWSPMPRRPGRYCADLARLRDPSLTAWPPGRNARCWCGSGRLHPGRAAAGGSPGRRSRWKGMVMSADADHLDSMRVRMWVTVKGSRTSDSPASRVRHREFT